MIDLLIDRIDHFFFTSNMTISSLSVLSLSFCLVYLYFYLTFLSICIYTHPSTRPGVPPADEQQARAREAVGDGAGRGRQLRGRGVHHLAGQQVGN